jgi:hypothetical protein
MALACAVVTAISVVTVVRDAPAAVVCQHGKRLVLRAGPGCKRKEQVAVDFGALAARGRLDALDISLGAGLGAAGDAAGITCPAAPGRRFVATALAGTPPVLTDGCRTLGGDRAACDAAFQSSPEGPVSCWFYASTCLPCLYFSGGETYGGCTNACNPPQCAGAPSRRFIGDEIAGFPDVDNACAALTSQARCEGAFETRGGAISCYWDATTCRPCNSFDEHDGKCTNACDSGPRCRAHPGPPTYCTGTTQAACETQWVPYRDVGVSCFWTGTACDGCYPPRQFVDGVCQNQC